MLVNAYGSLYGSEGSLSVSSRVRGAHRYLAKSIFCKEGSKFADLNNDNGWLDINKISRIILQPENQISPRKPQNFTKLFSNKVEKLRKSNRKINSRKCKNYKWYFIRCLPCAEKLL